MVLVRKNIERQNSSNNLSAFSERKKQLKNYTKSIVKSTKRYIPNKLIAYLKALKLLVKSDSYLLSTGLIKSYERGYPCRKDGSPLPWMNYAIITFLEERLKKEFKIFEYGSGYSTLFFSSLVDRVVSVEYSQDWYEKLKKQITSDRIKLIYQKYQENGEYCRLIEREGETFDIVVIDGRDRVRCALNSISALSEKGVIIFDDTTRDRYQEVFDFLFKQGFKKIDFEGIQPAGFKLARTSIFYRTDNCLGI